MTFIVKVRTLPGSPMMSEYECPEHGRFEQLVTRDELGDPPAEQPCEDCGGAAQLALSAPLFGNACWVRAINPAGSTRNDKPDPRALDTEPLATGKMSQQQWRSWQAGITAERRYQRRLKSGRISKKVMV